MTTDPIQMNRVLGTDSDLAFLTAKVTEHRELLNRIRGRLPQEMAHHCLGAAATPGSLLLWADSSVWASRLRFTAPGLLQNLPGIERLRVRVLLPPRSVGPQPKRSRPRRLSEESAILIEQLADSLQDEPLGEALRRLARAGKSD